jgi:uncharacterized protein (UPF0147 family)
MTSVDEVIQTINDILDDPAIQKNIRMKLEKIIGSLKACKSKELKLKCDSCIGELDDICNDTNIQPFVRTQIWSIVSMLESLE